MLTACTHSDSLDDYYREGESITRSLILELKKIRSRDDLLQHASQLENLFDQLGTTMIAAQAYKQRFPQAELSAQDKTDLSEQLRSELNRVLRLEGGREVIEKAQEPALKRIENVERHDSGY